MISTINIKGTDYPIGASYDNEGNVIADTYALQDNVNQQINDLKTQIKQTVTEVENVNATITNLADDEDITSVDDGTGSNVLKFADRTYNANNFSGKGYKILRKNIQSVNIASTKINITEVPSTDGTLSFTINSKETQVVVSATTDNTIALVSQKVATALQASMTEYDVSIDASLITLTRKSSGLVTPSVFSASTTGVVCTVTDSTKIEYRNILTQGILSNSNTIYEIRYDFDLNQQEVIIPEGCHLIFNGGSLNNGALVGNDTQTNNIKVGCILKGTFKGNVYLSQFINDDDNINFYNGLKFDKFIIDRDIYVRPTKQSDKQDYEVLVDRNIFIQGVNNPTIKYKGIGDTVDGYTKTGSCIRCRFLSSGIYSVVIKDINLYSEIDDELHPNGSWSAEDGVLGWWNANDFLGMEGFEDSVVDIKIHNVNGNTVGQEFAINVYGNSYNTWDIVNSNLISQVWPSVGSFTADSSSTENNGEYKSVKEANIINSSLNGCTWVGTKNAKYNFKYSTLIGWFEICVLDGNTYNSNIIIDTCTIKGGIDNTSGYTSIKGINGTLSIENCNCNELGIRGLAEVKVNNCNSVISTLRNGVGIDVYNCVDISFVGCNFIFDIKANGNLDVKKASWLTDESLAETTIIKKKLKCTINNSEFVNANSFVYDLNNTSSVTSINKNYSIDIWNSRLVLYTDRNISFDRNSIQDEREKTDITLSPADITDKIIAWDGNSLFFTYGSKHPIKNIAFDNPILCNSIYISFDYEIDNFENPGSGIGLILTFTCSDGSSYKYGYVLRRSHWIYNGIKEVQATNRVRPYKKGKILMQYVNGKVRVIDSNANIYIGYTSVVGSIHTDKINISSVKVEYICENYKGKVFFQKLSEPNLILL